MDTWPDPQPAPPVKHVWRNLAIGGAVLIAIGAAFATGEELAETNAASAIHVTQPTYRTPPTSDPFTVTAEEVVDAMGASTVDEFCDLLSDTYGVMSESEAFGYFADGYGTDGPPYASTVWTELKSRCTF